MSPLATTAALLSLAAGPDALVVLSRHTGEIVRSMGDVRGPAGPLARARACRLGAEAGTPCGVGAAFDPDLVAAVDPPVDSGLAPLLREAHAPPLEAARVQVFGLLDPDLVRVRCERSGQAVRPGARVSLAGEVALGPALRKGALVCDGGPWLVRVPGAARPRPYAGVFFLDPAPEPGPTSPGTTPGEARARRGSDVVFRTTRLLYAAGVVAAEDAAASGPAREALALVADANGRAGRHPGRPPCDTTHCQVFLATAEPRAEERAALARPLAFLGWLPFSRGGLEPWSEARAAAEVERVLGTGARSLAFGGGRVRWVQAGAPREAGCEALRGPLHLPSCPESAATRGGEVVFTGRGMGHGEGLDLEAARRSGLPAEALLERAYGPEAARREAPR